MLAVLFFHGGGRYVSLDYWLGRLRAHPQGPLIAART
jgi:hypothetical protein